jgi:hypothetical protein
MNMTHEGLTAVAALLIGTRHDLSHPRTIFTDRHSIMRLLRYQTLRYWTDRPSRRGPDSATRGIEALLPRWTRISNGWSFDSWTLYSFSIAQPAILR